MSGDDETTEPVGYGKPPAKSRFRAGQSGNPKGRPKGSLNVATVLLKTLREKVVINENGRRRKISKLEASVKQLVNKAASGDLRALSHLFAMTTVAAEQGAETRPSTEPLNQPDQEVLTDMLKRYEKCIKEEQTNEIHSD
jgi:hypothetical protein